MSRFLNELDFHFKEGSDTIRILNKPLFYYSSLLNRIIRVPDEFNTDFSSVPRVPIAYWFWGGRSPREAVVHDYLFREDSIPLVPFDIANKVFKEAMQSRKKSRFIVWPMYLGVKFFAGGCYHKKRVLDKL